MAQEELVKILRVETQGSERTVKSLKDEITSLKDALLNVEQGTENYDAIVNQLRKDQDDLIRVMNAGKQGAEALEGSYNYLTKTMSELKKEWRSTTDEVRRNQLGQEIDNINAQLKDMDASIGNYQRNVGNYSGGFSDAMKEMRDSTEQSRAKLESIQKVASGLASGYAAVQGAMALFGVENEKLSQTFVKLQAAIALAQGIGGMKDLIEGLGTAKVAFKGVVTGVRTFITSLNGIKAAIVGTGIGALVVGVGLLIQHLMKVKDEAKDTRTALDKLTESFEAASNRLEWNQTRDSSRIMQQYIKDVEAAAGNVTLLAQAEEKYNKALADQKIKDANDNWKQSEQNYLDAKKAYNDARLKAKKDDKEAQAEVDALYKKMLETETQLEKSKNTYLSTVAEQAQKTAEATIKTAEEQAKKVEEANQKAIEDEKKKNEEIEKVRNRLLDSQLSAQDQELKNLHTTYEEEKKLLEGRNEDLKLLEETYQKDRQAIIDKYDKETKAKQLEALQNSYNKDISSIDAKQSYKEQETELKYDGMEASSPIQAIQLEIDKLDELRQIRLEAHNERLKEIDELLSSELVAGNLKMELEQEKANMIRENALEEKKYILENAKLNKEKTEEDKKLMMLKYNASVEVTSQMLKSVGALMKEGSKEQKGIATASAIIDTYKAANAAYSAMAGIPLVGPALGAAAAAAAIVSGIANVKAIWAVDENGETSSNISSTASVTPSFNAQQAMPIEYTRNIMTTQETDALNHPQKVYVLESDITETQNKVEVMESNATF